MAQGPIKPFLIQKDESGNFRLTVRTTRYNSIGYPIVSSKLQDEIFETQSAAKAFARKNFNAEAGEYATK
ncbi:MULTISPECIES: hypothetical protein [Novosphingobium]|uniref:DUF1508 domain-containing protein n=2 Tax=Novosphingobium TaxID=165696 RepID=A0ABT0AHV9_9SPHN|nr:MULTISPECIES: hypothetical protein [Novosphingobium]MED5547695.1 hypothetical protein [Pseudomonadota bacterium]MCJ1962785.1 hypothetical protein [Novosphingobium mangrovi (ex Hu et al. 2023)]QVM84526.1 hypothetical protein HT578_13240 [Novosphingobium decolorationis]TYC89910.1 hypothetical protein FMM79_07615 [Novosphingobium sp. BW1]GAM04513.1 hypothetical conserved protein [Novosphingobium sp. MBES04]